MGRRDLRPVVLCIGPHGRCIKRRVPAPARPAGESGRLPRCRSQVLRRQRTYRGRKWARTFVSSEGERHGTCSRTECVILRVRARSQARAPSCGSACTSCRAACARRTGASQASRDWSGCRRSGNEHCIERDEVLLLPVVLDQHKERWRERERSGRSSWQARSFGCASAVLVAMTYAR